MGEETRDLGITTRYVVSIESAEQVIGGLVEFSAKCEELVDSATAELRSLPLKELKERNTRDGRRFALRCMSQVCDSALRVVDCANDLVWYLSPERMKRISDQVTAGNFGPLRDLLIQMKRLISRTEDSYQKFSTSCDEASRDTSNYAQSCREDSQAALRKKENIKFGGAMGSALGIFTGVGLTVATIVAGIIVGVVGAFVVLGIGASAAGTAAVVGAQVTAHKTNEYRKTAETLQSLAEKFKTLYSASHQFQQSLADVKRRSDYVGEAVTATSQGLDSELSPEAISIALDRLGDKGKELSSSISSCKSNLTAKRDVVANEIWKK